VAAVCHDFLPYTARSHTEDGDEQLGTYLFFDEHEVPDTAMLPVGACGFWYTPEASCWVLGWIWLHPFARRRGHLRAGWPTFRRQYSAFAVQRPLSDAMAAFLRRVEPIDHGIGLDT
jgi:hypothetical protein